MGELRVVPAAPSDLEVVIEILEEVAAWLETKGIDQWPVGSFRRSAAFFAGAIERGEVHLAYVGEDLAGTLRLVATDPDVWSDLADESLYVHSVAVRRSFAGRRLGRQLLEWAEQRAREAAKGYLRLDCVAGNPVLRQYYEDAGFSSAGEVEIEFKVGPGARGKSYRLHRYEKPLRGTGTEGPAAAGGQTAGEADWNEALRAAHPVVAGLRLAWREYRTPVGTDEGGARGERSFGLWTVVDNIVTLLGQLTQEDFERNDERMPYFGIVWPSAEALVMKLLGGPRLEGVKVLDLGCGLGACGFAAAHLGARVTFLDWEPRALEIVRASAREQDLPPEMLEFVVADWRDPPALERFELIIGADLLYEKRNAEAVADFLSRYLQPGGQAWIVDPGRPYARLFPTQARIQGIHLTAREVLVPKGRGPGITLLRMRKPRWRRLHRVQARRAGSAKPPGT
ncbi:MAG: GNAT family N-acetyltransferase [Chloroflexi bacterium]|nr:GNAT family N-acetyltransferase [Chloroflexota bacterium]